MGQDRLSDGALSLVPADFAVPTRFATGPFVLEALGPEHNERDHAAWSSSIEHIRATDGFVGGRWPHPMSLEENLADLRQCIRLNLDCADVCGATGRMVARQARPEPNLWRAMLEACAQACRSCAEECRKHEGKHEHCRICREACERCERACRDALSAMPQGGAESRH